MPIARVKLPNGKIGRFEVPKGMTPEQIEEFVAKQSGIADIEEPDEKPELNEEKEEKKKEPKKPRTVNLPDSQMIKATADLVVATQNTAHSTRIAVDAIDRNTGEIAELVKNLGSSKKIENVRFIIRRDDEGLAEFIDVVSI